MTAEERDSMAKHAKPYVQGSEQQTYSINVEELFRGLITIEAGSLDEAMSLARDIVNDRKVSWYESQTRLMPELS